MIYGADEWCCWIQSPFRIHSYSGHKTTENYLQSIIDCMIRRSLVKSITTCNFLWRQILTAVISCRFVTVKGQRPYHLSCSMNMIYVLCLQTAWTIALLPHTLHSHTHPAWATKEPQLHTDVLTVTRLLEEMAWLQFQASVTESREVGDPLPPVNVRNSFSNRFNLSARISSSSIARHILWWYVGSGFLHLVWILTICSSYNFYF